MSVKDLKSAVSAVAGGNEKLAETLFPLVYDQLRKLARYHMQKERGHHTLQATALVNEAFLKLVKAGNVRISDRGHFIALASQVMRRLLLDYAKSHGAQKRAGERIQVTFQENLSPLAAGSLDIEILDGALQQLNLINARAAQIVEYRFFGGMTFEEIAEQMEMSVSTVKRDWETARLWLYHELQS